MAVAPLFAVDMPAIKSELRLSGIELGSDAARIVDRGVMSARVGMYQRLGLSIVAEMIALVDIDAPTTLAEVRRKACTLMEIEWVRRELVETMPVMVADAGGDAQQLFNDEGVWRGIEPEEMVKLIERATARIEELAELILNEDDLGADATIRVWDGSRDSTNPARFPAGTIYPTIGQFTGNFEDGYHVGNAEIPVRFLLEA